MKIYYITVIVHYNHKETIDYYFDNKEIAKKYIENIISNLKKSNVIEVKRYPEESTYHIRNEKELNHVYKIHELNKFLD